MTKAWKVWIIGVALAVSAQVSIAAADTTTINPEAEVVVNRHGVCRRVANKNPHPIMVPHLAPNEWAAGANSFLGVEVTDIDVADCGCQYIGQRMEGGQCIELGPNALIATMNTHVGRNIVYTTSRSVSNSAPFGLHFADGMRNNQLTDRTGYTGTRYCTNASFGGYNDWYVPAIDEVMAIIHAYPDLDLTFGNNFQIWSSTYDGGAQNAVYVFNASVVNGGELQTSGISRRTLDTAPADIVCVRRIEPISYGSYSIPAEITWAGDTWPEPWGCTQDSQFSPACIPTPYLCNGKVNYSSAQAPIFRWDYGFLTPSNRRRCSHLDYTLVRHNGVDHFRVTGPLLPSRQ